jgi:hypothetical protein
MNFARRRRSPVKAFTVCIERPASSSASPQERMAALRLESGLNLAVSSPAPGERELLSEKSGRVPSLLSMMLPPLLSYSQATAVDGSTGNRDVKRRLASFESDPAPAGRRIA